MPGRCREQGSKRRARSVGNIDITNGVWCPVPGLYLGQTIYWAGFVITVQPACFILVFTAFAS